MAGQDSKRIADEVVAAVGGTGNIVTVTHCVSRLRMELRDYSVDDEKVGAIKGVMSVIRAGKQYQVVIGTTVGSVYDEVVKLVGAGSAKGEVDVDGNAVYGDAGAGVTKQKMDAKQVGQAILDYLSGSMVPVIPAFMVAGLFKTIEVIFGPVMLGLFDAESDLYFLLEMIYNAGMYFIPIFIGYTAAKKLGASPILGLLLAAILIEPSFVALADEGGTLSLFGLPILVTTYSTSVLPVLLSVWVLSYVESFWKRVLPDVIVGVFAPFLTVLVMAPVSLIVLAPLGSYISNFIIGAFNSLANMGGVVSALALMVYGACAPFLVSTGMHVAVFGICFPTLAAQGYETFFLVASQMYNFALFGTALAHAFARKDKVERADDLGIFVSGVVGGITEPTIYGICAVDPRAFIGGSIGSAVGALVAGMLQLKLYSWAASNILGPICFVSPDGDMGNLVSAVIASAVAFVAGFIATSVLCRGKRAGQAEAQAQAA